MIYSAPHSARLGDIAMIKSGINIPRPAEGAEDLTRIPIIGAGSLINDAVVPLDRLELIETERPERSQDFRVQEGDTLLTGRGTVLKFGLVGKGAEGGVASGNVIIVRPFGEVVPAALYSYISSDAFRPRVELLRRGSTTLLSLSAKDLAKLEVSLPPIDEQHRIASLVLEAHDAYRNAILAAEQRRDLTKQIVMQRLFGETS